MEDGKGKRRRDETGGRKEEVKRDQKWDNEMIRKINLTRKGVRRDDKK